MPCTKVFSKPSIFAMARIDTTSVCPSVVWIKLGSAGRFEMDDVAVATDGWDGETGFAEVLLVRVVISFCKRVMPQVHYHHQSRELQC